MDVRAFLQKSWVPPLTLGLAAFVSVAVTLDDPGVTWDEAYPNIPAAERQAEWLTGLGGLEAPFSQATVDAHAALWKRRLARQSERRAPTCGH